MSGREREQSIEILLQMDGIMAKGYGVVAKFPMRDTALKIKDKAIYAYLCALSGSGVKAWPTRGKILADLQIGKTAFYNSMDRLIQEGYLSKTSRRMHGERGLWTRTVYTIELNPKRYQDSHDGAADEEADFSTLEVEGMLSDGWGFAPRLVMQDPRISIREKGLYVYLLTYASAGRVAYPDVRTITYHLGISEESYRTLIRRLCQLGYIIRRRKRNSNGQLSGYDYYICRKPTIPYDGAEIETPSKKPEETENSQDADCTTPLKRDTVKETTPFKRDTVHQPPTPKQDTVKPDTANQDTGNPDTANEYVRLLQDSSNTNFTTTSQENHKPTTTSSAGGTDRQTADLEERIKRAGGIPTDILDDEAKVVDALKLLGEWDWRAGKIVFYDEDMQKAYPLIMETLVNICTRKTTRISNLNLTRENIVEKLNRCCDNDQYGISLWDFIRHAVADYCRSIESRRESGKSPVRNPARYAACVIWSATDSYLHELWQMEQEEKYFY